MILFIVHRLQVMFNDHRTTGEREEVISFLMGEEWIGPFGMTKPTGTETHIFHIGPHRRNVFFVYQFYISFVFDSNIESCL
jgi:hypothetical protein